MSCHLAVSSHVPMLVIYTPSYYILDTKNAAPSFSNDKHLNNHFTLHYMNLMSLCAKFYIDGIFTITLLMLSNISSF